MGLLLGTRKQPYLQTVTTACHHCVEPACAEGCPVLAYDKNPITGIVSHLDDQCIGCSYCILKCPYDVPKFNLKAWHCAQVRHVPGQACRRGGPCLRAGLPE